MQEQQPQQQQQQQQQAGTKQDDKPEAVFNHDAEKEVEKILAAPKDSSEPAAPPESSPTEPASSSLLEKQKWYNPLSWFSKKKGNDNNTGSSLDHLAIVMSGEKCGKLQEGDGAKCCVQLAATTRKTGLKGDNEVCFQIVSAPSASAYLASVLFNGKVIGLRMTKAESRVTPPADSPAPAPALVPAPAAPPAPFDISTFFDNEDSSSSSSSSESDNSIVNEPPQPMLIFKSGTTRLCSDNKVTLVGRRGATLCLSVQSLFSQSSVQVTARLVVASRGQELASYSYPRMKVYVYDDQLPMEVGEMD